MSYVAAIPDNASIINGVNFKLQRDYRALNKNTYIRDKVLDALNPNTALGKSILKAEKSVAIGVGTAAGITTYAGLIDALGGTSPIGISLMTAGLGIAINSAKIAVVSLGAYGFAYVYRRFLEKNKRQENVSNVVVNKQTGAVIDSSNMSDIQWLIKDLIENRRDDSSLNTAYQIYDGTDLSLNSFDVNAKLLQALAAHRKVLYRALNPTPSLSVSSEQIDAAHTKLLEDLREVIEMDGCSDELRNNETIQFLLGETEEKIPSYYR